MKKKVPVHSAYRTLLRDLDPRVADSIRDKYSQDRIDFIQAAREFTPDRKLAYWASSNCKKCYGTGSKGVQNTYNGPATAENRPVSRIKIRCQCAEQNYMRWLADFRLFYNALKRQTEKYNREKEGQSNGESDTPEATTKSGDESTND